MGKRLHASSCVVAPNQYSRLDGLHCLVLPRQSASLIFATLVNIHEARLSVLIRHVGYPVVPLYFSSNLEEMKKRSIFCKGHGIARMRR